MPQAFPDDYSKPGYTAALHDLLLTGYSPVAAWEATGRHFSLSPAVAAALWFIHSEGLPADLFDPQAGYTLLNQALIVFRHEAATYTSADSCQALCYAYVPELEPALVEHIQLLIECGVIPLLPSINQGMSRQSLTWYYADRPFPTWVWEWQMLYWGRIHDRV